MYIILIILIIVSTFEILYTLFSKLDPETRMVIGKVQKIIQSELIFNSVNFS